MDEDQVSRQADLLGRIPTPVFIAAFSEEPFEAYRKLGQNMAQALLYDHPELDGGSIAPAQAAADPAGGDAAGGGE